MSRIIALPSLPVKPTRVGPRKPAPFGSGILASRPAVRDASHTAADDLWWAQNNETPSFAPDYDAMAAESYAMDCLERGLIPSDVADYISRTTLVGHPA